MQMLLCRKVPGFDGVNLATDIFLPDGPGPFPCVITRTPYSRAGLRGTAQQFTESGYAYVTQDCRGKYDSDGEFIPLDNRTLMKIRESDAKSDEALAAMKARWQNNEIEKWNAEKRRMTERNTEGAKDLWRAMYGYKHVRPKGGWRINAD